MGNRKCKDCELGVFLTHQRNVEEAREVGENKREGRRCDQRSDHGKSRGFCKDFGSYSE